MGGITLVVSLLIGACTNGINAQTAAEEREPATSTTVESSGEPSATTRPGSEIPVNPGDTPEDSSDPSSSNPDDSDPDTSTDPFPDDTFPEFTIPELTTPDGTPLTIPEVDEACVDSATAFANLTLDGLQNGEGYQDAKQQLAEDLPAELQDELTTITDAYDKLHDEGFLGAADALASDEFTNAINDLGEWLTAGCPS
jgi:hypothetical protein